MKGKSTFSNRTVTIMQCELRVAASCNPHPMIRWVHQTEVRVLVVHHRTAKEDSRSSVEEVERNCKEEEIAATSSRGN